MFLLVKSRFKLVLDWFGSNRVEKTYLGWVWFGLGLIPVTVRDRYSWSMMVLGWLKNCRPWVVGKSIGGWYAARAMDRIMLDPGSRNCWSWDVGIVRGFSTKGMFGSILVTGIGVCP